MVIPIRQIREIRSGTITVTLPANFPTKRAEVIIFPIEDNDHVSDLQDILLGAPMLSEDDLQEFAAVREWMSQWRVNDF